MGGILQYYTPFTDESYKFVPPTLNTGLLGTPRSNTELSFGVFVSGLEHRCSSDPSEDRSKIAFSDYTANDYAHRDTRIATSACLLRLMYRLGWKDGRK